MIVMNKTAMRSICAGLVLLGSVFLARADSRPPGVIYMKPGGPRVLPVWVSAEELATSEKGSLQRLFSESDLNTLRSFVAENKRLREEQKSRGAQEPTPDCLNSLSTSDEDRMNPKPNRSFSDLTEQAIAIYSGRIEEVSTGFFSGIPSSLLRVKVSETFRSSPLVASGEVLVPYPFAQFKVGDSMFCGGRFGMYQPRAGDKVLVFIYDPPLNAEGTLVYPRSPEIFFQTSAGRLIVPDLLKTDRAISAAANIDNLKNLLLREP
jgi:hypothetical protein